MVGLVVKNARILGRESETLDVAVVGDKISQVGRDLAPQRGTEEIDAEGNLLLPTFVEPHVHLDKAFLAEMEREASSIAEAREIVKEAKRRFTPSNVRARMERIIPSAIENGVTAIRTHIDVDPVARLSSLEAVLKLREVYSGLVDIQVVAFPQEGLLKDSESKELISRALEMGADIVGGLPEAEGNAEDSHRHIDHVFKFAEETRKDIDVHCDVLPHARTLEYFASSVIEKKMSGRATADHLIALAYYDDEYAAKMIDLIKRAGLNVISNPCTMITGGTTERPPLGRGVTRIGELVNARINIAFGLDNLVDPYNPFGDFNPLANGWLFAYAGRLSSSAAIEQLIRMPTFNSAAILRLEKYGVESGCYADFNILGSKDIRTALRLHEKPRYVVKRGKILVENKVETTRHFSASAE
jgi:cytosine deaminase